MAKSAGGGGRIGRAMRRGDDIRPTLGRQAEKEASARAKQADRARSSLVQTRESISSIDSRIEATRQKMNALPRYGERTPAQEMRIDRLLAQRRKLQTQRDKLVSKVAKLQGQMRR